jgi:hypothetical protein
MSLGWIFQGATRPAWEITLKYEDNSAFDITGSTMSGVLRDRATLTTTTLTAGSFAITSSNVFTYSPVAADTTMAGFKDIIFGIDLANQPYYISEEIEIRPRF